MNTPRPLPHRCRKCNQPLSAFLVAEGLPLLWYHANQVDHHPDPIPEDENTTPPSGICDFCSTPKPTWVYTTNPPHDAVLDGIGYNDDGRWAACDACHDLIRRGEWKRLATRSVKLIGRFQGVTLANVLRRDVETLHAYFRAVYIDAPERIMQ